MAWKVSTSKSQVEIQTPPISPRSLFSLHCVTLTLVIPATPGQSRVWVHLGQKGSLFGGHYVGFHGRCGFLNWPWKWNWERGPNSRVGKGERRKGPSDRHRGESRAVSHRQHWADHLLRNECTCPPQESCAKS